MLTLFDRIYAVSHEDGDFFHKTYGVSREKLMISGDPKYDRVLERAAAKSAETTRLKMVFEKSGPFPHRLIAGSAHKPDVETILKARTQLGQKVADWQLVFAPHHLSPEMISWLVERCAAARAPAVLYSTLEKGEPAGPCPVVILDTMGMLAEAYGTGTAAFIGGALHYQVHNVLEPACRGLALAFGPLYKNSQEAVQLVSQGLADVVHDPAELVRWWEGLLAHPDGHNATLRDMVSGHAGAANRIWAEWRAVLNLG